MQPGKEFLWQRIPAFRILLPFICGILIQWYLPLSFLFAFAMVVSTLLLLIILQQLSLPEKFRLRILPVILINVLFFALGCIALHNKHHRNKTDWFANQHYDKLIAVITEPPVEKTNSFRVPAKISYCIKDKMIIPASGKVMLSFTRSWSVPSYGDEIIIYKKLSEIKTNPNPGGFNYRRYCEFNGISHQGYLTTKDFGVTGNMHSDALYEQVFKWRSFILQVLRRYLPDPKIYGLAEALLIGYKDDLDKDLVKAYANTGVVHVIAISGLHLALVYGLLMVFTKPLSRKKWRWLRFVIVVSGLWLFSILAGAQPSILRASVMFTLIALRLIVNRNGSVYNSIAIAAFVLLAWNPFWLWDTGFQLSFLAVLSIIVFYRKVYPLLYFQNKAIDFIWQLAAASIAAQILTIPVTVYYFHQFPFLFLITNIVAVPLSSLIVYIEIFLCVVSPVNWLAGLTADLLKLLIGFMNGFIERINQLSFGNWTGLSINFIQVLLLYCIILSAAYAIINRSRYAGYVMLFSSFAFVSIRSLDVYKAKQQKRFIVYNIPKRKAIDFFNARKAIYAGDSLRESELNYVAPTRIVHRVSFVDPQKGKAFLFRSRSVVILDSTVKLLPGENTIDILVLSGRRFMKLADISKNHIIKQVVICSDVPAGKAYLIQKDCELFKISCYTVVDKGAFVVDLQ
jgi:competence protein ComEC